MESIPLNVEVTYTDGNCGKSSHVIINPLDRSITHVVVEYDSFSDSKISFSKSNSSSKSKSSSRSISLSDSISKSVSKSSSSSSSKSRSRSTSVFSA